MDDDLAILRPVLRRRYTSRLPYTDERVPQAVLDALRSTALLEGGRLLTPGPWDADTVPGLVHDSPAYDETFSTELDAFRTFAQEHTPGPSPCSSTHTTPRRAPGPPRAS
ncbi:hypothetical protein ACIQJ4_25395 [Streptomyces filamentosus]|uniref:hypothetical protein n=1 Tax=Streptomyces filamentosus TaxID=67294 RepID=UPI0037F2F79E